jgi:hypothetical protein
VRPGLALALGLVACAVYAGGAWLSGSASPIARRPLLDGTGFLPPYNWVNPPAGLGDGNKQPDSGDFTISFKDGKSDAGVFATIDQQASAVMSLGSIPEEQGASDVHLTITPLDPATIGAPPTGFSVLGNAYRFEAAYRPTGGTVTTFDKQPLVVLVYPGLITHGSERTLLYSPDGTKWTRLTTTDDPTALQASATVDTVDGYFEVVAKGVVTPTGAPGSSSGGSIVPWIVIGAAVVVAAALTAARLRARSKARDEADRRALAAAEQRATEAPRGTSTRRKQPKKRRR